MRRKRFLIGMVFALAIIFCSGSALAEPVVDEWRIPYFNIMTGPYAFVGHLIKWVNDETLKEINDAGGVAGRPLVFAYRDTALDPVKTVAEVSKYVTWITWLS